MPDNTANLTTLEVSPVNEALTSEQLVADDLIEEVSIDGMCGVY